jgi:glycosyltransferase involved in cell wall biosynthesis
MESTSKIKRFILWLIMLYIPSKKVKYITTISNFNKQTILNYLPTYPQENILVIPVSVSETFRFKNKEYNFKNPTILQIGTAHNKNITRLIKSLINIPCKLIIVGELQNEDLILLRDNKIIYENYINISNNDLIRLYTKSDILTFVSTYEGFGMPIIEANIMGLLVITSNICSMPEVASNSAILVDPYDVSAITNGILRLISDENLRLDLLTNGFENCKRYQADLIANMYL